MSKLLNPGIEAGRKHRKAVSRKELGTWAPTGRSADPLALLRSASQGRIPSLLRLKYDRMAVSPFTYFRGAAAVMAYDLSLAPSTGILTQLCGDAHGQNLGAYEGIDGRLIFDINDFDETIRGPFEWDVKRMATSLLLAGRSANLSDAASSSAARSFVTAYCRLMRSFASMPILQVARYAVLGVDASPPIQRLLAKAERASPQRLLDKLTMVSNGHRIFRSDPPLLRRVQGDERKQVLASLTRYRQSLLPERQHFLDRFQPLDVAFKVVGTGAVGLRNYCVYLQGNGPADPLFLQIKQEVPSAYQPYVKQSKTQAMHQGQRVAEGQRAMQLQSDPMLGWTTMGRLDYLVRQLNDHKATVDLTTLQVEGLVAYAQVCGEILARGHARAGDATLIAGYIGKGQAFATAILTFAGAYAEQTRQDYKEMLRQHPSSASKAPTPSKQ